MSSYSINQTCVLCGTLTPSSMCARCARPRTCSKCAPTAWAALRPRTRPAAIVLAGLALATSVILPAAPARAAERGPMCVGYDVLEVSPGLSATDTTTGTVHHVGPLGQETCYGGDPLGYKATGPIGIEHFITYSGTCSNLVLKGYALHHIPTADGVKTIRNDFTAGLGKFEGRKFSGTYVVRDLKGDCVSAPLTRFRADYVGYFNDNTRD